MLGNYSEEAQFILIKAREEMLALNHPYIGTEHLVLSILKNNNSISQKLLKEYNLTYDIFKKEIIKTIGIGTKKTKFLLHTPLLKKVMENAMLDAKDNNHGEVTVEHLFSSLLEVGEGIAIRILIGMDIDIDALYDEFSAKLIKKKRKKKKLMIEQLGVDLNQIAKKKKIDPVVGREKEINRLIEILCRREKNNPILIGEAGVGKTAIVEELASKITKGEVPLFLQNKRIISIDMGTMVSGTKYRGEFEERMQNMIKEVSEDEDIILFIDEVHTLVGAGGAEGAIDASNILKPALARGSIRCIGATTTKEYKKYIEQDKALERRFQKIVIEEPNTEECLNILKKIKPIYEKYHHVTIPNKLLKKIIELSNKYIYNRHNPDKIIDILDEVSSKTSIKETETDQKIKELKQKLNQIRSQKNSLIIDKDITNAYTYLKKESILTTKINELLLNNKEVVREVTIDDIAEVIHEKSGIPIYEVNKNHTKQINELEKKLKENIIGQDTAIDNLIHMTKRLQLGYSNHKIVSYLFVGPTGVGKTKLAKLYTNFLYDNNNLIKIDMSEYSDATSINKIIGSAPGYVGYQDQNTIVDQIKEKPHAIILLDEIDKAHPKVINLLYQILDEGMIKDKNNQEINLNHNIIIMTSNLGFEETKLGFNPSNSHITNSLKEKFSTALINRMNQIIIFKELTEEDMIKITQKKLELLKMKYPKFNYSKELIKEIIKNSQYQKYGARKLEQLIDSKIENIIIDKIINKEEITINHLNEYQETT